MILCTQTIDVNTLLNRRLWHKPNWIQSFMTHEFDRLLLFWSISSNVVIFLPIEIKWSVKYYREHKKYYELHKDYQFCCGSFISQFSYSNFCHFYYSFNAHNGCLQKKLHATTIKLNYFCFLINLSVAAKFSWTS